ncbi:hypothetical protein Tco_1038520 [Tanacetum coccineum]
MKLRLETLDNEGHNPRAREASKIRGNQGQKPPGNPGHTSQNTKHEIMEEASLITTTLIGKKKEDRIDKHGLPPTKRLFKVT